jgi:hypothetical protein
METLALLVLGVIGLAGLLYRLTLRRGPRSA